MFGFRLLRNILNPAVCSVNLDGALSEIQNVKIYIYFFKVRSPESSTPLWFLTFLKSFCTLNW